MSQVEEVLFTNGAVRVVFSSEKAFTNLHKSVAHVFERFTTGWQVKKISKNSVEIYGPIRKARNDLHPNIDSPHTHKTFRRFFKEWFQFQRVTFGRVVVIGYEDGKAILGVIWEE